MPSKRRHKRAPRAKKGNAEISKPISLEGFNKLPVELQQHIINLACCPSSSSSGRCLFGADTATALSLCLASRGLNRLATVPLYREIDITRPSALYFFQRTIQAQPQRAKLTRRIHFGPLEALSEGWWPLRNAYHDGEGWSEKRNEYIGRPFTWIKTSLRRDELPSGYEEGHTWAVGRPLPGCREAVIADALHAAQVYFSVNVDMVGKKGTTKIVEITEVQAALDLALQAMRAHESTADELPQRPRPGGQIPLDCLTGQCQHYTSLSARGAGHQRQAPRRTWSLSNTDAEDRLALLRHIARPGAVTDRFDHPLIFARSGFEVIVGVVVGKGHKVYPRHGCRTVHALQSESWDFGGVHEKHNWPDMTLLQRDNGQWEKQRASQAPKEDKARAQVMLDRNDLLINTGTLGQTLSLARSVLAALPSLQDVSLTGLFQGIFVNFSDKQTASHLRRLSLGPSPPFWEPWLALRGFERLEFLHLCGMVLAEEEIVNITHGMPRLKLLQWTMFEDYSDLDRLTIVRTIELLLRRARDVKVKGLALQEEQLTSAAAILSIAGIGTGVSAGGDDDGSYTEKQRSPVTSEKESAASKEERDGDSQQQHSPPPNDALIIAKLHPSDVLKVLNAAPSPDAAKAWREGRKVTNGQRRLLLQDNFNAFSGVTQFWLRSTASDLDQLYEGVRSWWRGDWA